MTVFTHSQYRAAVVIQAKSRFLGFARNDKGFLPQAHLPCNSSAPLSRVESPLFLKIVGGFRRALSEWRAPSFALIAEYISPRVAQPPTIFRKSGNRALLRGDSSGRLFFGYFLLAKQKKVTCRRATPGKRHDYDQYLDSRLRGNDGNVG
jgi:hypothetical protein